MPVGADLPGGQRDEPGQDGRHGIDPRDAVTSHIVPKGRPVKSVVEDEGGTGDERRQQPDDFGVDVEKRQGVEAAIGGREPVVAGDGPSGVEELAVAQPDQLGRPGRPRRRQDESAARRPGRRPPGRTVRRLGVGQVEGATAQHDPVGRQPGRPGPVAQHDGRAYPAADGRQLGVGCPRIERCGHPTGRDDAEKDHREVDGVGDGDADGVAGADAEVVEQPGPPGRRPSKVAKRHEPPSAGMLDVRVGGAGQRAEPDELGQMGPERHRPAGGRRARPVDVGDEWLGSERHDQYIILGSR